jgi:hypothetical protein
MKPDAVPGIGVALVFLTLAIQAHPVLQVGRAIVERRARAALARLAMTKIDALGFPLGNDAERPAMALPNPLYRGLLNIRMTTPHYASHTFAAAGAALQMVTIRSCPRSKPLPGRLPAIACLELARPFDNGHTLLLLYLRNVSGLRAHPL